VKEKGKGKRKKGGLAMPIKYSLFQRPRPGDPTAPRNFYAILQSGGEVRMRELAEQI